MSTVEKDVFSHPKGSFERLNNSNYSSWKNNTRRLLRSIKAWDITSGTEQLPPILAGPVISAVSVAARAKREDFVQRREDAAGVIYNACTPAVRVYIDGSDDPHDMWLTLSERLDTASTAIGRQALYRKFMSLKPAKGEPIGDFLASLLEIRNQIACTPEQISDVACKTHIFSSLPDIFDITSKILQSRSDTTVESIIDALKEDERIRGMCTVPDAATEAFYGAGNRRGGHGARAGRGRGRGTAGEWCTHCNTGTHSLENCWSKGRKRSRNSAGAATDGQDSEVLCWHCGDSGHRQGDCPVKRRGNEARAGGQKKQKVEGANAQISERDGGNGQ